MSSEDRVVTLRTRNLAAVLMMVAAACTGGSSPPSTPPGGDEPSVAEIIALEGTEAQAPYLADGEVTPAEREAAFLAMVACMEDRGVEVTDYELQPRGGESIFVTSDLPEEAEDRIVRECRQEYYLAVAAVYARQHEPSEREVAQHLDRAAECMRSRGLPIPAELPKGVPEYEAFAFLADFDPQAASTCWDETER